jgi:A/G-specific adenine glycosylase
MKKGATLGPVAVPAQADEAAAAADIEVAAIEFRERLSKWYRKHARDLPWRGVKDPYATWLSEIMLQQTRVATVIDRYREFLKRFPALNDLAGAEENDVLALWSGLGYYRRARMLHRGAQFVVRELGGKLPRTAAELKTLPGVGVYTAAAIASIAFGESIAVVDGNVERVLLRIMGLPEERSSKRRARVAQAAQALVPAPAKRHGRGNPPGDHNQAMMELGATICLPKSPLCLQCPVVTLCRTRGEHATAPREKQKSSIVAHLLSVRKSGTTTEVLLERRPAEASLMPGMLELPPLPMDAVEGHEPVLRVRHAITNTNYYAQIFSEGAIGDSLAINQDATADREAVENELDELMDSVVSEDESVYEDDLYVAEPGEIGLSEGDGRRSLLNEIPTAARDLCWTSTSRLHELPLTGLARKVLQRLGVMRVPAVRIP